MPAVSLEIPALRKAEATRARTRKRRPPPERLSVRAHLLITGLFSVAMLGSAVMLGAVWPIPTVKVPADWATRRSLDLAQPVAEAASPSSASAAAEGEGYGPAEVAPYFEANEALRKAKAAFDANRFRDALALLEDQGQSPPVRYLRGLSAMRAENYELAASEMSEVADHYPALNDRALYQAGVAYFRLRQLDKADLQLSRVSPGSSSFDDARLLLADVRAAAKDLKGAREALRPLLDGELHGDFVRARALLEVANLARDMKDKRGERSALLSLWAENPGSSFATVAAARLGRIPDEAKVRRAEAVLDSHHNRDALSQLKPLIRKLPFPSEAGCLARVIQGKALRKERRHSEAIASLQPVLARCRYPDLRVRAYYVLGDSQAVVDPEASIKTYDRLASEFPKHSFADDALFTAAELDAMRGNIESALARLARIGQEYPEGDHVASALFKQFWLTWKKDPANAELLPLQRIERMPSSLVTGVERARARYWHAKAFEARGEKDRALEAFERAARHHAGTFHGQMARLRLAELDPVRSAVLESDRARAAEHRPGATWRISGKPPAPEDPLAPGVELYRLGMPEARRELLAASKKQLSPSSTRLLFHLLAASGNTEAAYGVARAAVRGELGELNGENALVWAAAFPHKFRESIERNAGKADVDPNLLQALVREESAFGARARSGAGALGLTQLMPDTAAIVAKKLGMRRPTGDALFNPNLNLRLGAKYLSQLRRQFDGNDAFAVASYNAGPGRVARWARVRGDVPLDEFVEEIPIDETRGYVQRVLSSYRIYGMLRPDGSALASGGAQR